MREAVAADDEDEDELDPEAAARVVRMETNAAYEPVLSTEEVAEELDISVARAFELLDEGTRPRGKAIGDTHAWWW